MHPTSAYMHPRVSAYFAPKCFIDMHPESAYFAANRFIDMHPRIECVYAETLGCMFADFGCMYAKTLGCKVYGCWVHVCGNSWVHA